MALDLVLLLGPRGVLFLMIEVPLYASNTGMTQVFFLVQIGHLRGFPGTGPWNCHEKTTDFL